MNEKSASASTSKETAAITTGEDDDRIPLLGYEQNLMLDTFTEDVLFVMARGLGMERLFLNHLHLYSDRRFTVLVLNTAPEDEQYFLEKLKALNPDCPPKVLTAEVLSKDRELIYNTGGVQFVTSRILMVDLLTGRVPTDRVAGILVYRAHQLLHTYQESFILRLYREKKQGGFVKAFTDHPGGIAGAGIGQLQRLIDRLYVRRVRVVPRFDADVKDSYDADPPKFIEYSIELPQNERRLRAYLVDIIGTCVRELKQSTHGTDMEVEETEASDSTSAAGLNPSALELQLRKKTLMLSERQERLLNDLQLLRGLLQRVEDLDPVTAFQYAAKIRGDKDIIDKNSGWIFTSTAAKVFSGLDSLCSAKDAKGNPTIVSPAKWSGLRSVLAELTLSVDQEDSEAPVLVLASNERTCRQLIDLVKFGDAKMCWMLTKSLLEGKPDNPGPEPETLPLWNPDLVVYYDSQVTTDGHKNLVSELKQGQKKASRPVKKRGMKKAALAVETDPKQPKLVNFGIVRYREKRAEKRAEKRGAKVDLNKPIRTEEEPVYDPEDPLSIEPDEPESSKTSATEAQDAAKATLDEIVIDDDDDADEESSRPGPSASRNETAAFVIPKSANRMLVFLSLGNRYNLINCLENLRPSYVVLYHTDVVSTRLIETFKAHNKSHPLHLYALMQKETIEEERYLLAIQREQTSLELLIREQGVLLVPTEYDVSRDSASHLRSMTLQKDTRDARRDEDEEVPKVIVDMREFNSELPTVLYRRGIDLVAATLEVGDYVLSPQICVERKALDDLAQSLTNGRVFKQTEQMVRNYARSILLVESNEKFRQKRVNGGPFQGELSRRSRETRSLLAMLIRANPQLTVLWSLSPAHSAELFEEIKLDQPNPDMAVAMAIRSDDLGRDDDDQSPLPDADAFSALGTSKRKLNGVLKRQLCNLPGLASGDVDRLMSSGQFKDPAELVQAPVETLAKAAGGNRKQAEALNDFFRTDFRLFAF